MALTEIPIELSSTPSIVDGGNATAITINADESVTLAGTATAASFASVAGGTFTTASGNDLNIVYPTGRSLFIKEGSDTHVTVDNTGNVGIGATSLSTKLEVADNNGGAAKIRIRRTDVSNSDVDLVAGGGSDGKAFDISVNQANRMRIDSSGTTTFTKSGGGNIRIAETASRYVEIMGYAEGAANGSTMAFSTIQAGTSTSTERMRISSDGGITFKTVGGATAAVLGGNNVVNGLNTLPSSAGTPFVVARDSGTTRSAIFGGGVTVGLNLTLADGNLVLANGHGIDFSATAGSGTSELLDDYETGQWVPTIEGDGASTSGQSYTTRLSRYTKIGSFVFLTCDIGLNTLGSIAGSYATIKGLPFSVVTSHMGGGSVGYYSGINNNSGILTFYAAANQAYLMTGGSGYVARGDLTNTTRIICTIIYQTGQ